MTEGASALLDHLMPSVSPHDDLVTIAEAAALLGVSERTVARLQADGTLQAVYLTPVRRAKIRRFRRLDVERIRPAHIKAAS